MIFKLMTNMVPKTKAFTSDLYLQIYKNEIEVTEIARYLCICIYM